MTPLLPFRQPTSTELETRVTSKKLSIHLQALSLFEQEEYQAVSLQTMEGSANAVKCWQIYYN
jgi:hypothetical protein